LINSLGFNWTPVMGDTSNTRIFMSGMTEPEQNWWPELIKNGTSTETGEIDLGSPVMIARQPDGTYNFPITVESDQANGTILLNFNATIPGGNFVWEGQFSAD
jgi:hypothetical protein